VTAVEVWADPVRIPQVAGGDFPATLFTVWKRTAEGWRRVGATTSERARDAMIAQVTA
jgi:hypothetical protein